MKSIISLLVLSGLAPLLFGRSRDVILALETSPGTEQAIGLIRSRLFQERERVGVVTFDGRGARLLQPLTTDHDALDTALQKAGIRINVSAGPVQINSPLYADVVGAITASCDELTRNGSAGSKRAIIVLFGSEDPGLQRQVEAMKGMIEGARARLYAIVIDRSLAAPQGRGVNVATPRFPALTARIVSDIAAASGGKAISKNWDIKPILEEVRKP